MKRRLFANEHELRSLGHITLTTHRVIAHARHGSGEASMSLMLDQVQWTRLASGSHPGLIVASGVLGASATAVLLDGSLGLGALIAALCLLSGLLHATWRPTTIVIGCGNGRIRARLDGDPDRHRQARSFLDAVDHAAARDEHEPSPLPLTVRARRPVGDSHEEDAFHAYSR